MLEERRTKPRNWKFQRDLLISGRDHRLLVLPEGMAYNLIDTVNQIR